MVIPFITSGRYITTWGGVQSLLVKRGFPFTGRDNDLFLISCMVLITLKETIAMVLSEEKYEFLDENFGRIKKRLTREDSESPPLQFHYQKILSYESQNDLDRISEDLKK